MVYYEEKREELVSVIIPFYNCERYIRACLMSVVNQTYQNIEILLINDGSTDASGEIVKSIAKEDHRIKIISQDNNGVSKARNLGINHSRGKYICFIDADDKITREYIERLVYFINEADIVICGFKKIGNTEIEVILDKRGFITKEELYFNTICNNKITAACWNKIYKANIIKSNRIQFNEKIAVGEDMVFLLKYFGYCDRFFYIDEALYIYRKSEVSVMQSTYNSGKINTKVLTALDAVDEIINVTEDEGKEIKKYVSYRVVRTSIWVLLQMIIGNRNDNVIFRRIKINCRDNFGAFIKIKGNSYLEKILGKVLCISPRIVYYFGNLIVRVTGIFFVRKYLE